jgi:Transposase and inactivated derivatives
MAKPLSLDLRKRVIATIEADMSCRAAAERFRIALSPAVKWRRLRLETGSGASQSQGGDTRSGLVRRPAGSSFSEAEVRRRDLVEHEDGVSLGSLM